MSLRNTNEWNGIGKATRLTAFIAAVCCLGTWTTLAQEIIPGTTNIAIAPVTQWQSPGAATFTLNVSGSTRPIAYWFLCDSPWMTVAPSYGSGTGETDVVTLRFYTENMNVGLYTGRVTVVAPNATNTPLTIPVTIAIANNPAVIRGMRVAAGVTGTNRLTVTLPVQLISTGDVNAAAFSLAYDNARFTNVSIALGADAAGCSLVTNTSLAKSSGRIGVMVSHAPPSLFAAGTQEVLRISYTVAANASPSNYFFRFTNSPVVRQLSSALATPLPATWSTNVVIVSGGIEADVSPRGTNDFAVSAIDVAQVARFAAGLDAISLNYGGEFQRADCATAQVFGDAQLTVMDWVQAARYAAALDPLVAAAGPVSTIPGAALYMGADGGSHHALSAFLPAATSLLRVVDSPLSAGVVNTVPIELIAQGGENTLGFSIQFDPAALRCVGARAGSGWTDGLFMANTNGAASGNVGFVFALSGGQTIPAGTHAIALVDFMVQPGMSPSSTPIGFGDVPVIRSVANSLAREVPALFTDGHFWGLWADASNLGGQWRWMSWFGMFADLGGGWIYHNKHAWMNCRGTSTASIWMWDPAPGMGWLWTSDPTYPFLYRMQDSAWLWYQQAPTRSPHRWFANFRTGLWEEK